MKKFMRRHHFIAGVIILALVVAVGAVIKISTHKPPERITATVERGPVKQLVSVSGVADAKQSADLTFPVSGTVGSVSVKIGDVVKTGDVLATLDARALLSDRRDAQATLASSLADRDELLAGPQSESRQVTEQTVRLKEETLATTKINEANKVENARRTLLSSGLSAYTNDASEEAVAPIISGTYTCDREGSYTLDVYVSSAASGYSYKLSGLESGSYAASVDQAIALGNCGLRIQFDEDSNYSSTRWYIEIPNTKSASYTAYKNAYDLAVTQADSAIALAEQELVLARATATNTNAPARSEAVARANASVAQAQARIDRIDAELADRSIVAPFDGTVTALDVTIGETVGTSPIMTLLSNNDFEIKARIPEIDIGKLALDQKVEMVFDAKSDTVVTGVITFISLKATEIDGVSYYEAYIKPDTLEPWIRSGLNADIDIILDEAKDALRIPSRFLITEDTANYVLKADGDSAVKTPITVILKGNDGFVAITGLNQGDVVVAP